MAEESCLTADVDLGQEEIFVQDGLVDDPELLPASIPQHQTLIQCPACDFCCYYDVVIEWHTRTCHFELEKTANCMLCGIKSDTLDSHLQTVHEIESLDCMAPESMYEDVDDGYACCFCDGRSVFEHEYQVVDHIHFDHFRTDANDCLKGCEVCGQQFESEVLYNSHVSTSHELVEPSPKCYPAEIPDLIEEVTDTPDYGACYLCGKEVANEGKEPVIEHLKTVHGYDPYYRKGSKGHSKCCFCEKESKHKYNVLNHIKNVHLRIRDKIRLRCKKCGFGCTYKGRITQHVQSCEGPRPSKTFQIKGEEFEVKDLVSTEVYFDKNGYDDEMDTVPISYEEEASRVDLEGYKTNVKQSEIEERRQETKVRRVEAKTVRKNDALKDLVSLPNIELVSEPPEEQTCALCHETVVVENFVTIADHLKLSHGRDPYFRQNEGTDSRFLKCWFCDYESVAKNSILQHTQKVHLQLKSKTNYRCTECDFGCTYNCQMEIHIQAKHKKCPKCDFVGHSIAMLKRHQKQAHNNISTSQFQCLQCDYLALSKADWSNHVESHHSDKNYKFMCDLCPFGSDKKSRFDKHIELKHPGHSLRSCTVAKCKFVCCTLANFVDHMNRVHHKKNIGTGKVSITKSYKPKIPSQPKIDVIEIE